MDIHSDCASPFNARDNDLNEVFMRRAVIQRKRRRRRREENTTSSEGKLIFILASQRFFVLIKTMVKYSALTP